MPVYDIGECWITVSVHHINRPLLEEPKATDEYKGTVDNKRVSKIHTS